MIRSWQLIHRKTGQTVVEQLQIADGFLSRLVGVQFRRQLPLGAGLLLVPCGSVHTCFVRFPLDLVFLDRRGSVLDVRPDIRPWRVAFGPCGTHAVLELPAGTAQIRPGESLTLAPVEGLAPPRSVRFLMPE